MTLREYLKTLTILYIPYSMNITGNRPCIEGYNEYKRQMLFDLRHAYVIYSNEKLEDLKENMIKNRYEIYKEDFFKLIL